MFVKGPNGDPVFTCSGVGRWFQSAGLKKQISNKVRLSSERGTLFYFKLCETSCPTSGGPGEPSFLTTVSV